MGFVPLIEVTRGDLAECQHWGAVAVSDRNGRVLAQAGDPYTVTFTRSTIKVFQSLFKVCWESHKALARRVGAKSGR